MLVGYGLVGGWFAGRAACFLTLGASSGVSLRFGGSLWDKCVLGTSFTHIYTGLGTHEVARMSLLHIFPIDFDDFHGAWKELSRSVSEEFAFWLRFCSKK